MISLKIFQNKSFVETPLPIIFIFFTLSGFIFFALNLVLETLKKDIKSDTIGKKNYKILK